MSEPCRSRRGEGYEARDDEKQEKAPALFCAGASTSARSAGSFQGWPLALFWAAEKANNAVLIQKGKKDHSLWLSPDAISKNGGFSIVKDKKDRHTVWLEPTAWDMVEGHYHGDNCSTKNEYIEKAIRFYSGYLDAAGADEYLPRVLADVLEGKLGALGSRIGRLLFKLTVELDMNANILAALGEYNPDGLERLRGQCVQNAKQTNGEISFEDALRRQKGL